MRLSRSDLAILVALLVGAFALRLWHVNQPSIWHDEAWSIRAIHDPVHTPDDNTPPVYYAVMHVLWRGAGDSPLALRYDSILLDLITIALAARIMIGWVGRDAAVLTVVLMGTSPLLWAYAREVRAYVAVPLLTLMLLWLASALITSRERFPWRAWITSLVAELVFLYTHNLSVPVIVWFNLVVGGVWLWERRWRWVAVWGAGQVAALVAYIPWLMGQSPSGTGLNTPPRIGIALVWDIWQGYFAPLPVQIGAENALVIGSAVLGAAVLVSVGMLLRHHRDRRTLLLLSQALLIPMFSTVLLLAAHIDFHPRYYIAGLPAMLMLIALSLEHLPEELEPRRLMVAATALACALAAASLPGLMDQYRHDDFHALADYYAELPADTVILIPYGFEPTLEIVYADRIQAEVLDVPLHSSAAEAINSINAVLARHTLPVHVELLTWYQLPADVRGMYPCLLEAAGQRIENVHTVFGLSTQGFQIERPLALSPISTGPIDYGLLHLDNSALEGEQSVCVQTRWTLQQPTRQSWRVTGRILTTQPPGWIIARSDTDIRQDDQTLTSGWDVGDSGDAFSLLRFPDGTPPGEYTVQIGAYSAETPRGLDRLINGVPSGTALALTSLESQGVTAAMEHIPAREQVSIPVTDTVTLIDHDAQPATLNPGQELRITLRWHVTDSNSWTAGTLALRGADWEVSQPVTAYPEYSLDWHAFVIPAEASGSADLVIEAGDNEPIRLVTYTIEQTDRLFVSPPFDHPVRATFTGLATLEGFSVEPQTVSPDESLTLTLVWRGIEASKGSYRVFTHLLDAEGRVIAQHDGYPVDGERLTTGWVRDEYIVDVHALTFLSEGQGYQGPAHLEIGFYDPETGYRVPVSGGGNYLILPVEITVE